MELIRLNGKKSNTSSTSGSVTAMGLLNRARTKNPRDNIYLLYKNFEGGEFQADVFIIVSI
jgi:hypothetical protein